MAFVSVRARPPYSMLVLTGVDFPDIGDVSGEQLAVGPNAVSIGTLVDVDGETLVELSDETDRDHVGLTEIFEGELPVDLGSVQVRTVDDVVLLELPCTTSVAWLRVFVNDTSEPDHVRIVVRSPAALME